MKSLLLFVVAIVALGVVGCTDQTSVTDPVSDGAVSGVPGQGTPTSGQWNVDHIVYVVEKKEHYLVHGIIEYRLEKIGFGFTFTADMKLEAGLIAEKSEPTLVNESFVGTGEVSKKGNTIFVREYNLGTTTPDARLRVEFEVGESARLKNVSVLAAPFVGKTE